MRLRNLFLFIFLSFLFSSNFVYAEKKLNIEYILDSSNSMNELLPNGEKKIDAAKRVLCSLVDSIASEATSYINVGLRIYGANTKPEEENACKDTILYIPINGVNASSLKEKINASKASGCTPIAYSLDLASKDFSPEKDNTNVIVLVSDGKETCGGDPVALVKQLKAQGFDLKIYVIGFAVDNESREQLQLIANTSGGSYYNADNADQLNKSLIEIKQRSFEEYTAAGKEVTPTDWINNAPPVTDGDYKGNIGMDEIKFYKVKVYKGQMVKASLIVKKTAYSASNGVVFQTFSLKLFDQDSRELSSMDNTIKGNPEDITTFKTEWTADRNTWVYIAVSASKNHNEEGNPVAIYPKDTMPGPSPYTLKVSVKGDKPAEADETLFKEYAAKEIPGSAGFENVPEIGLNEFVAGNMYMKETRFYKLPVKDGNKKVYITALVRKPWYNAYNGDINMTYKVKVYDEDSIEITNKTITISKNPPVPFSVNLEADTGTNKIIYISITASDNHSKTGPDTKVGIYPENFMPSAAKYSVLVSQ